MTLHPTRLHPARLHPARRALRLASTLAVTGLCVGLAPQALAAGTAGTGGAMKLSGAQADKLAAHAALDPYGDGGKAENPTKPEDTTAPKTAGKTPGKTAGKTPGENVRKGAETDAADAPVTFTAQSTLEGARGMGATVPVGKNGDYFLLTSLGTVQRRAADGTSVWERTNSSLYQDWKVSPQRPWQTEPYPARVLMGYNAVSPFTPSSDSGYATGDLTGDGTDDLVFTASVGAVPYRPFTSPGSALPTGTFVTVVDGRTGATVWSKLYDYASHVRIAGHTLLVADSPRQNTDAPAADTAKLTGTRFSYAAGVLTPSTTWTYDTGETGIVSWGDLQDLGKGRVAVSWDRAKTENAGGRGRTLLLAAADGSVTWSTDSLLYSRQLRPDSARKRIVAVEQSDATDGVRYEIAAYDLGSGRRATLDSRVNVLPTALAVGDLTSREGAEYAVAESSLDDNLYVNASTVRALDGADPHKALWSSTIKRDAANARDGAGIWRLQVVDGTLVTSAQDDERNGTAQNMGGGRLASLTVFSGKGAVKWQEKGLGASPMYQDVFDDAGGGHVRVVDQNENVRTYRLGNGKKESLTPLRADIAYAKATDVNKDGTDDVVMAGSSNGVWAYSGPSLATGKPEQLWQATVPGAVHDVETGDVNGDGRPEIVVAADSAVVVLNARTGRTLTTIDGGGGFVRSVRLTDLDGDGVLDLLVPTGTLDAYDGAGHRLWTYAAPGKPDDLVFSDPSTGEGRVYVSYSERGSIDLPDAGAHAVALDARTGKAKWDLAPKAPAASSDGLIHAALSYHGTFASPDIPYANGHAVVYLWDIQSQAGVGSTDGVSPHQYMEIRDGRTGEVVHATTLGGLWTHNDFFTDDGVLYEAGTASFRAFRGEGTEDTTVFAVPQSYGAGFATGPGGRKLLIGGVEGGVYAWSPDIFDSTDSYVPSLGSAVLTGGRNQLAADLDGDGGAEVLSLNGDDYGMDRIAEDLGGRYLVQDNGIHQVTTYTLS
ncbi:FG-GAP-like repeat-containing protein [Streptomyces sp. GZWMJZ-114]|uniref:FG-GAP repeat domain-containing protein n=1 Tax=Streptomyces sp. GZWMJZ-114 TaxID=2494734 RepID=UPI0010139736|nr:FG-GAP-like repeat-containing protein [Streptomyces sp. GZWMJZ-114]